MKVSLYNKVIPEKKMTITVCIPVYKGSSVLPLALQSIFSQTRLPDEIVICDDNQPGETEEIRKTKKIVNSFRNSPSLFKREGRLATPMMRYSKNKTNLGSAKTIKKLATLATGDIIFYLCQDDILAKEALQKTYDPFLLHPDVGVVTRPFFWFEEDIRKPIRAVLPYDSKNDSVLSIFDGESAVKKIFESVGQISGLAYRNKWLTVPFTEDVFVGHIYPFAGILRKHKCVFLKDYTVAVGSKLSQSRLKSTIYDISPTEQWVSMFKNVFREEKYKKIQDAGIDQIASHVEGLVQIKNYAHPGLLQKEIGILIQYRPKNLISPKFWFYVLLCLILPREVLIKTAYYYKTLGLSWKIKDKVTSYEAT